MKEKGKNKNKMQIILCEYFKGKETSFVPEFLKKINIELFVCETFISLEENTSSIQNFNVSIDTIYQFLFKSIQNV